MINTYAAGVMRIDMVYAYRETSVHAVAEKANLNVIGEMDT